MANDRLFSVMERQTEWIERTHFNKYTFYRTLKDKSSQDRNPLNIKPVCLTAINVD